MMSVTKAAVYPIRWAYGESASPYWFVAIQAVKP
jgi:hypothetical protein